MPYEEVPNLEMPASAREMLLHYLKEGRFTTHLYGAVTREKNTDFVILEEF